MPETLMSVPVEIRRRIFRELIASTIAYIGFDEYADDESLASEDSREMNTALLRTCHQISIESSPILVPNITLKIWNTKALIDFLYILRAEILKSIRYIKLFSGDHIPLWNSNERTSYKTHHVDQAFCMFPDLALNLLTAEDCYHMPDCYLHGASDMSHTGTYNAIDGLIRIGGWKELHYITPTTQFMSDPTDDGPGLAVVFPSPQIGTNCFSTAVGKSLGLACGCSLRVSRIMKARQHIWIRVSSTTPILNRLWSYRPMDRKRLKKDGGFWKVEKC